MASLLDTIRGNLSNQQQKQGATDQGEQLRKLLGAKSGKASSQGNMDSAKSSLGEQSAVDQINIGNQALDQQGQIQAQQVGQLDQAATEADRQGRQELDLASKNNLMKNRTQTAALLGDLSRDRSQLDSDKGKTKLEQLASNLALQDTQYTDRLQQEGQMQRLNSDLEFDTALKKAVFADNQDLLSQDLTEKAATAKDMRDWNESLAHTKIIDMINKDKAEGEAAAKRAKYQAVGSILTAGTQIAGSKSSSSGSEK